MSITVILEAQAKAGRIEDLKVHFDHTLADTRAFEGCQGITVYQDHADPAMFVVIQHWLSAEHYERYLAWRAEVGDAAVLEQLITGRSRRFLDPVSV